MQQDARRCAPCLIACVTPCRRSCCAAVCTLTIIGMLLAAAAALLGLAFLHAKAKCVAPLELL